jgi:NADH dehydrogenase
LQHLPLLVLEFDVHNESALAASLVGHDGLVNLVAILRGNRRLLTRCTWPCHKSWRAPVAAMRRAAGACQRARADPSDPQTLPSMYLRSRSQGEAVLMQAAANGARAPFTLSVLRPVVFGAEDHFLNLFARLQVLAPFVPLACADVRFQPGIGGRCGRAAVVRCLDLGCQRSQSVCAQGD